MANGGNTASSFYAEILGTPLRDKRTEQMGFYYTRLCTVTTNERSGRTRTRIT